MVTSSTVQQARRRASPSSWTSAPDCPHPATCTRSPSGLHRNPGFYVDNDPVVLAHAWALLTSSPEGRTGYIRADLRDPAEILDAPQAREVLDFTRPAGPRRGRQHPGTRRPLLRGTTGCIPAACPTRRSVTASWYAGPLRVPFPGEARPRSGARGTWRRCARLRRARGGDRPLARRGLLLPRRAAVRRSPRKQGARPGRGW